MRKSQGPGAESSTGGLFTRMPLSPAAGQSPSNPVAEAAGRVGGVGETRLRTLALGKWTGIFPVSRLWVLPLQRSL